MKTLTENLNTILDNFQMVVNSGQTCSVYRDVKTNRGSRYEPIINIYQSEEKVRERIDYGNLMENLDGIYPIIPLMEENKMSKKSRRNYRTKDILVNFNITDEDKDLMKKWFLSGGIVKEFTFCKKRGYTKRDPLRNRDWWYFTKGLLFRFHNYLTINLLCEDLTTIDEKLCLVLRDMVSYHTNKNTRDNHFRDDDLGSKKFIPLETLYEDKEIESEEEVKIKEELKELKSQVQELITQLKTKEEELESLVV